MEPSTILVPVDLSDRAAVAVSYAGDLARRLDARLVITINVNLPERAALETADVPHGTNLDDTARLVLQSIADTNAPGVTADIDVRDRDFPAEGILAAIGETGADLVVIASHGRSGPSRWLLGSVAEKIVRSAPVPVLVVPVRDES